MAVVSKLFEEILDNERGCAKLVHPGSCTLNALMNTYKFLGSNAKYFAPVIFLPLLMKVNRLNKDLLKDTLKYYAMSVLMGTFVGWTISVLICVFRNLPRHRYTFLYIPSALGGLCILAAPETRTAELFKTSIFQCTIEAFIIKRKNFITRALADSVPLQTLIFMCCSAAILHASRQRDLRGFWFIKPCRSLKLTNDNEERPVEHSPSCGHKEKSCTRYLLHGVRNYLIAGLALDLIKMFMSKIPPTASGFGWKLLAKCKNFKIRTSAFFAFYVGIYRMAHCYLNRTTGADTDRNHLVAGFLAGSCFPFYSKITLLSYSLLLAVQTYWRRFKASKGEKENKVLEYLKQVKMEYVLYSLSMGYLVHVYGIRRRYISGLGETIINGVTNNYAFHINRAIEAIERQIDAKTL